MSHMKLFLEYTLYMQFWTHNQVCNRSSKKTRQQNRWRILMYALKVTISVSHLSLYLCSFLCTSMLLAQFELVVIWVYKRQMSTSCIAFVGIQKKYISFFTTNCNLWWSTVWTECRLHKKHLLKMTFMSHKLVCFLSTAVNTWTGVRFQSECNADLPSRECMDFKRHWLPLWSLRV